MIGPRVVTLTATHLSPEDESRLMFWLRSTIAWHTITGMVTRSRLRLGLVLLLSGIFWAALFVIFFEAFTFLNALHAEVISLLFNGFFSALLVMMVFSTAILMYAAMYTTPEAKLLLTLPLRADTIHAHKFRESLWFSSWGFILLGSPMLVAYGVVREAAWTYFVLLLPFMISFVVIPAAIGSICSMAMVAWLPRLRLHALSLTIGLAALACLWIGWSALRGGTSEAMTLSWFEETISRLAITEQQLLPSWWLSSGLIEAARRSETTEPVGAESFLEACKFLGLLIANGLLLHLIAGWVAQGVYRSGYSHLTAEMPNRRRRTPGLLGRWAEAGAGPGQPLRLLLLKDVQLFCRDVAQWSQFLIFFGLLGLYFLNLRSFNYNHTYASIIGFLNLAVIGLILSTFTTRFVYPSISLEGRRFWILGLMPVRRDTIVWSKFLFAFLGGLGPCLGLVVLSDRMLGISRMTMLVHLACCLLLCSGLSGIAVGLGARMPNLRESSPAKIAAGFGGTLSLVLSALYIMLVVLTTALPTHLFLVRRALGPVAASGLLGALGSEVGVFASLGIVTCVGGVATFLPLLLGILAFRRFEP